MDDQEIFCLYPSGHVGRFSEPYVTGFEEKIARLASEHPKLNWFWAPVGSVQSS